MSLSATKAQDKIVTIRQDTIKCRIISIGAKRITYEQKTSENHVTGKSIAISDVLQYFRTGRYDEQNKIYHLKPRGKKAEHSYLFTMQAGLTHLFTDFGNFKNMMVGAGVPASKATDYVRKLKNGYNVNAGFHYLLTSFMGIGADYTFSQSASEGKFLVNAYGGMNVPMYTNMEVNEKMYVHFCGPSVLFQQFPGRKEKIKISEILSSGLVLFRDENRGNQYQIYWEDNNFYSGEPPQYYDQSNSVTKGTTFGAKGGLSLEYYFTPQLSAGLAGNFIWAKLHKVSVKSLNYDTGDQELDKAIDVSQINYGFTLRYNF
jgi:hypothetical protein